MKVLIVGSDKYWAIENLYKRELTKYTEVELFSAHGLFHDYYYASSLNKIKYRIGVSRVLKKINQDLLEKVSTFRPDIVWVFKGMEIFPKTLMQIKESGIVLANYNPDHPFLFQSRGAGNKNVTNSIDFYDHHFTYSLQIKNELEERYKVAVSWLPFAYLIAKVNKNEQLIKRICFIGNPDHERSRVIKLLIKHQIPLAIYGNNWEKFIGKSNELVDIHPAVYKDDFLRVAQSYVCQLNLLRQQNIGSHNMRTFEMPALGCLMLSPRSEEHLKLFESAKEAIFYNSEKDLIQSAKNILNMEEVKIKEIQESAYNKSIESGYCYSDRAIQVFQTFEELLWVKNKLV